MAHYVCLEGSKTSNCTSGYDFMCSADTNWTRTTDLEDCYCKILHAVVMSVGPTEKNDDSNGF